jgi:hypothetical protein
MVIPNPFLPEMTAFALPLHALREELVEIAGAWADEHDLFVALERFFPTYAAIAVPQGADLAAAVAELEPVRRLCLRRGSFFEGAINERQHLVRNPECLTMVLEPVTEDGLRATAMTSRMGDEERLREWVGLVREAALQMHRGAYAIEPEHGGRQHVPDHFHTQGAHDLAATGVRMLSAAGTAIFEFYDLM